jgi:hypothetical protein
MLKPDRSGSCGPQGQAGRRWSSLDPFGQGCQSVRLQATGVIHEAGASGIDVHIIAHRDLPPAAAPDSSTAKES